MVGWALAPAVRGVSIAGACVVLIAYGAIGAICAPRIERQNPALLHQATLFGLLAGGAFALEVVLEYIVLPADNSTWGLVEFGAVFALVFISALLAARRSRRVRHGLLAAVVTMMIASLSWLVVVLAITHAFHGTPQQAQVLRAEGAYDDFARSGMSDFNVFVAEDFMGAAFFHLLLGPLVALLLGAAGGWAGRLSASHV